jgi:ABC-2 type transport system permease protein
VTTTAIAPSPISFDDRHTHTSFAHVLRSEWTKLWSVRSTMWTLLSLVVVTIGFSVLSAWGQSTHLSSMSPSDFAQLDVTEQSLVGLILGQLAIAVLGALVVTGEYSTGGIKATFTAVPNRMRVLAAKGVVFGVVATVTGIITAFGSFFLCRPFWAHQHLAVGLGHPGVVRALIGAGLYVLASGMFGFALGTVFRHSAGSITAAVGLLFIVPLITNALPGRIGHDINRYFTDNAGHHVFDVVHVPGDLSPWAGYLTITIWWVVPLIVGAWLMRTRDA